MQFKEASEETLKHIGYQVEFKTKILTGPDSEEYLKESQSIQLSGTFNICLFYKSLDYSDISGVLAIANREILNIIFYEDLRRFTQGNTLNNSDLDIKIEQKEIKVPGGKINCLKFSNCGKFLAVGKENSISVFISKSFMSEEKSIQMKFEKSNFIHLQWSDSGYILLEEEGRGKITILQLNTNSEVDGGAYSLKEIMSMKDVQTACLTKDQKQINLINSKNNLIIYDFIRGYVIQTIQLKDHLENFSATNIQCMSPKLIMIGGTIFVDNNYNENQLFLLETSDSGLIFTDFKNAGIDTMMENNEEASQLQWSFKKFDNFMVVCCNFGYQCKVLSKHEGEWCINQSDTDYFELTEDQYVRGFHVARHPLRQQCFPYYAVESNGEQVQTHQPPLIISIGIDGLLYGFVISNAQNLFADKEQMQIKDIVPLVSLEEVKFIHQEEEEQRVNLQKDENKEKEIENEEQEVKTKEVANEENIQKDESEEKEDQQLFENEQNLFPTAPLESIQEIDQDGAKEEITFEKNESQKSLEINIEKKQEENVEPENIVFGKDSFFNLSQQEPSSDFGLNFQNNKSEEDKKEENQQKVIIQEMEEPGDQDIFNQNSSQEKEQSEIKFQSPQKESESEESEQIEQSQLEYNRKPIQRLYEKINEDIHISRINFLHILERSKRVEGTKSEIIPITHYLTGLRNDCHHFIQLYDQISNNLVSKEAYHDAINQQLKNPTMEILKQTSREIQIFEEQVSEQFKVLESFYGTQATLQKQHHMYQKRGIHYQKQRKEFSEALWDGKTQKIVMKKKKKRQRKKIVPLSMDERVKSCPMDKMIISVTDHQPQINQKKSNSKETILNLFLAKRTQLLEIQSILTDRLRHIQRNSKSKRKQKNPGMYRFELGSLSGDSDSSDEVSFFVSGQQSKCKKTSENEIFNRRKDDEVINSLLKGKKRVKYVEINENKQKIGLSSKRKLQIDEFNEQKLMEEGQMKGIQKFKSVQEDKKYKFNKLKFKHAQTEPPSNNFYLSQIENPLLMKKQNKKPKQEIEPSFEEIQQSFVNDITNSEIELHRSSRSMVSKGKINLKLEAEISKEEEIPLDQKQEIKFNNNMNDLKMFQSFPPGTKDQQQPQNQPLFQEQPKDQQIAQNNKISDFLSPNKEEIKKTELFSQSPVNNISPPKEEKVSMDKGDDKPPVFVQSKKEEIDQPLFDQKPEEKNKEQVESQEKQAQEQKPKEEEKKLVQSNMPVFFQPSQTEIEKLKIPEQEEKKEEVVVSEGSMPSFFQPKKEDIEKLKLPEQEEKKEVKVAVDGSMPSFFQPKKEDIDKFQNLHLEKKSENVHFEQNAESGLFQEKTEEILDIFSQNNNNPNPGQSLFANDNSQQQSQQPDIFQNNQLQPQQNTLFQGMKMEMQQQTQQHQLPQFGSQNNKFGNMQTEIKQSSQNLMENAFQSNGNLNNGGFFGNSDQNEWGENTQQNQQQQNQPQNNNTQSGENQQGGMYGFRD